MSALHLTPGSQQQVHRVGTAGPAHRTARLQPTGVAPGFQPGAQGRQEKGLGAEDARAEAAGQCRAGTEAGGSQRGVTAGPASRVV